MTKIFACLFAVMALAMGSEARAEYVSADTLNCRKKPETSAAVQAKLNRGRHVTVEDTAGTWSRLESPNCWVLSRYLRDAYIAPNNRSATTPSSLYGGSRSTPKKQSRPANRSYSGSCPCSGRQVCIGPRGGRYCITSGGNKRYGV